MVIMGVDSVVVLVVVSVVVLDVVWFVVGGDIVVVYR